MTEFRLTGEIGSGGMATVYAAEWLFPGNESIPVACKILRPDRVDPRHRGLFWREAVINLRISHNHPRLVSVHECFPLQGGELCMVMERIEGCSLADLLDVTRPLPAEVVRRIAVDVLDGLRYMHSHDVLHRDISPNNLLISQQGEIKIADLGLAKPIPEGRGQASNGFCTFAYASPEVLRRGTVDPRSDLYSLGAVLYELVTGRYPYGDGESDIEQTIDRALNGRLEPLPAKVPDDLRALILGVLKVAPEQRSPSSAQHALDMLKTRDGAVAAPEVLGSMVKPIYETRRRERAPCHVSRDSDSIEAPIVLFGRPGDGWDKQITEVNVQIQRVEDDGPLAGTNGRLALWLILTMLVFLVPLGYLGWRTLANGSGMHGSPVVEPAPVEPAPVEPAPVEQLSDSEQPDQTTPVIPATPASLGEEKKSPNRRRRAAHSRRAGASEAAKPDTDHHYTPVPESNEGFHIFEDETRKP